MTSQWRDPWHGIIVKLFAIIKKNILRIAKSRLALLVVILSPIALMLIIGLTFNTMELSGVKIGVYAAEYPEYANSILKNIGQSGTQFIILKEPSEEQCKELVKQGELHLCLLFPQGTGTGGKQRVTLYVDYSRMNIVWTLMQIMSAKIDQESLNIGRQLSEQLLAKLETTKETLVQKGGAIASLQAGFLSFQQSMGSIAASLDQLSIEVPPEGTFSNATASAGNSRTQLATTQSEFEDKLTTYDDQLAQADESLQSALDAVTTEQASREKLYTQIDRVYNDLNCSRADVKDLTSYLSDPTGFDSEVASLSSPDCSFLFTLRKNLAESLSALQQTASDIEEMQTNITDARASLTQLHTDAGALFTASNEQLNATQNAFQQADDMITRAHDQVSALEQRKEDLKTQLTSMSTEAATYGTTLTEFNVSLGGVLAGLENASTITPESIVSPFDITVSPVTTKHTTLDYLFPSLFVLVIMFVAVLLGVTIINKEKGSRAHFRNFITPTPDILFILGTFLTCLLLTFLQIIIIALFGIAFFNIAFLPVAGGMLFIALLAATIFSLLGILIASLLSSEETSTLAGILTCIVLFFFSSTIIPVESMTSVSRFIAQFNPFYLLELLFRKQLIFDVAATASGDALATLVVELGLLFVATLGAWAVMKRRL